MEVICSWCNKEINKEYSTLSTDKNISHGICDECVRFLRENKPGSLKEFINKIQVPVLVVNEEGRVNTANDLACSALKKDIADIEDQLGGDVMECAYARLPEGCGQTVHCNACAIRKTVTQTFETGKGIIKRKAYQDIRTGQGKQRMMFMISTKILNDIILLKIERMEKID
jgi:hypothetical protein